MKGNNMKKIQTIDLEYAARCRQMLTSICKNVLKKQQINADGDDNVLTVCENGEFRHYAKSATYYGWVETVEAGEMRTLNKGTAFELVVSNASAIWRTVTLEARSNKPLVALDGPYSPDALTGEEEARQEWRTLRGIPATWRVTVEDGPRVDGVVIDGDFCDLPTGSAGIRTLPAVGECVFKLSPYPKGWECYETSH